MAAAPPRINSRKPLLKKSALATKTAIRTSPVAIGHPERVMASRDREAALRRVRKICLSLPETTEKEAWDTPTFRILDKKMFAMFVDDHHGNGRIAIWLKAPFGAQSLLVESDPDRFFVPPYVGPKGWIGIHLGRGVDWKEVAELVQESFQLIAPKRVAALAKRTAGN